MHFRFVALVVVFLFPTGNISAQTERPHPAAESIAAAPWWAQQMYGPQPNVFAVDSAFTQWRQAHPTERNYHTQFYKHWRRAIGSHLSPEGFWNPPTPEQEAETLRNWLEIRQQGTGRSADWECIGPFETFAEGETTKVSWQLNVYCLDQSASDPNTLYCGTEGGSIFKSTDKGENWTCVSDGLNLNGIGAVKIDPTDPNTVYFGQGNNLYKTTDGGSSWNIVLTAPNLNPRDISVNPANPGIVLVAAQNGLHRSVNGGGNWTQIFTQNCWDIEVKTDDASTVFLLKTNTTTKLCEFYKSTDYGASWALKNSGWINPNANGTTDNNDGGARLAVTTADPDRLYAVLLGTYNDGVNDNNYLGVYRSNTAGESWTLPNTNANGGPGGPYAGAHSCLSTFWFNSAQQYPNAGPEYDQGFYNLGLDASDTDANDFLVGFLNLFKSEDGGATFTQWGGYGGGPGWQHPDIQDVDISGSDVWVSSDGGINLYSSNFSSHNAKNRGLAGSDFWGFDGGWNEDVMTGGRYHNGNTATIYGTYPDGQFIRLGGAEETTGHVHPAGGRRVLHSDISPKILPLTVHGSTSGFPFTTYPNEGYAGNNENSSEIEPDPRCYNHLYLGSDNALLKSTDGGAAWTTLFTFGTNTAHIVTGIEVSRSNPDVVFCVQNANPAKLWRSQDGGQTFTQMPSPPGAVNGAFIALSATDENKIWLAWSKGGTSTTKIFESTDGGSSWSNLSSTMLDGQFTEQLVPLGGTDDGLYLATDFGVFYRSDSENNWLAYSDGLPAKAKINRLVPFYASEKMRIATYHRGIWQSGFTESPAQPIVQPTVDKLESLCARDTFYFDDYSMVNHSGATWAWTFSPAPQYVSGTDQRNPRVVFGAAGTYTATLTLNGSFTQSLTVQVSDGCDAQTVPGNALSLNGTDYAIATSNLQLNSNTVTFTCWVKGAASQNSWAPFLFLRGGTTTAGLGLGDNLEIRYHWDGNGWPWSSGFSLAPDVWTHVALVITPSNATIYVNGVPSVHNQAKPAEAFDTPLIVGWDPNSSSRRFNGLVDEVTVWDKALTQNDIRELMHLTKVPADQPNLVSYYQFNETGGPVLDRVSVVHASLVNGAGRSTSTAPVGGGVSARLTVTASGSYDFGTTGVTMQFPTGGTWPNGELCVSRLNLSPDQLPYLVPHGPAYWVVNNYGSNATFSQVSSIEFGGYGTIPGSAEPTDFRLYQRSSFADGNTWGNLLDLADEVATGANGSVKFSAGNGLTGFSQLLVTNEAAVLAVDWLAFSAALQLDKTVRLYWSVAQTDDVAHFFIEKSTDGVDFQTLGKVAAHTASGKFSYEAVDTTPHRGINYYRLKQVDLDGQASYSVIRAVTVDALANVWNLFPTPLASGQPLEIRTEWLLDYRLLLYDPKGRVVFEKTLRGDASLENLPLTPGVYGYQIVTESGRQSGKLVVTE